MIIRTKAEVFLSRNNNNLLIIKFRNNDIQKIGNAKIELYIPDDVVSAFKHMIVDVIIKRDGGGGPCFGSRNHTSKHYYKNKYDKAKIDLNKVPENKQNNITEPTIEPGTRVGLLVQKALESED